MLLLISALCLLLLSGQVSAPEKISGPYLGQDVPGMIAERFAPGIIPDDLHSVPVFSKDGTSVYYKTMDGDGIMIAAQKNNKWTSPKPLFDLETIDDSDDPCLSPSGDRLFFSSYNKDANRDFIYYTELTYDGVVKPQIPEGELNSIDLHWQFSMADNGNIYYSSNGNIYLSEFNKGIYLEPIKLDSNINTGLSECTPYINPDETLLLFARSVDGKPDIFMSKKTNKGNWSPAKPLNSNVNTGHHEMCPRITADGKYFFFISSREGLFSAYWVDARILNSDI